MKSNRFNFVAPFYDLLAMLVFGNHLYRAQVYFLEQMPENGRVLIVGGGTGQILQEAAFSRAAQIDFVELSEKMLSKAKQNGSHLHNIHFLNEDFFQHKGEYDFIIANFFLDCFDHAHHIKAVEKLRSLCTASTRILITDFQNSPKPSHRILIFMMIRFFKVFSSLQANGLEDIKGESSSYFTIIAEKSFRRGLLFSAICKPIE